MTPLAIDLFCGLGGWTEGLLAEGYRVIGFDIERHDYGDGKRYPSQLVLQDVLTLHGSQFKDAALIVASPPCQEYSYMAMPWSRAKAIAEEYRSGKRDVKKLTALFNACFRIQAEASEAAGKHIPLIVENVRGAIPWVGRSRWNYGSFHLWGDVPALMPMTKALPKVGGLDWNGYRNGDPDYKGQAFNTHAERAMKNNRNPVHSFQSESVDRHIKTPGRSLNKDAAHKFGTHNMGSAEKIFAELGNKDFRDFHDCPFAQFGSKSPARKAASAMIAKIPLPLARHIARVWLPGE